MCPAPRYTPIEEEKLVLDAAAKCIRDSSLLDFKMSAVATEAGISMGSVYKHVQSKEDVLVALATRMMASFQEVLALVMNMPLTIPERLIASVMLNPEKTHEEPFGVHLEMLIGNEPVLRRASPRWLGELAQIDQSLERIFIQAIDADDGLRAKGTKRMALIEELMLGLWSLHVGFIQVAYQRAARHDLAEPLPFPLPIGHPLFVNATHLINAYPWNEPLTNAGIERASKQLERLGYR